MEETVEQKTGLVKHLKQVLQKMIIQKQNMLHRSVELTGVHIVEKEKVKTEQILLEALIMRYERKLNNSLELWRSIVDGIPQEQNIDIIQNELQRQNSVGLLKSIFEKKQSKYNENTSNVKRITQQQFPFANVQSAAKGSRTSIAYQTPLQQKHADNESRIDDDEDDDMIIVNNNDKHESNENNTKQIKDDKSKPDKIKEDEFETIETDVEKMQRNLLNQLDEVRMNEEQMNANTELGKNECQEIAINETIVCLSKAWSEWISKIYAKRIDNQDTQPQTKRKSTSNLVTEQESKQLNQQLKKEEQEQLKFLLENTIWIFLVDWRRGVRMFDSCVRIDGDEIQGTIEILKILTSSMECICIETSLGKQDPFR
ncbi:MAG: hypothetical protein EZS28_019550 [Streblomastix strix]|uniref:Uncharacterized protein n=1 Tax=Streblomastix strix TaxID=222440 RepID=A0A5J4VQM8_9EUKA|nr:MAG: hypothetical protein EZS28_019550 [Streblomastix strix]